MDNEFARSWPGRLRAPALTALAVAAVLVLITACSRPGAQSPGQNAQQQSYARLLAYSRCMRAHGVPNYPDPTTSGGGVGINLGPNSGVDTNSPQFKAAQQACRKYAPGPGSLSPTQLAQMKADELATARCMRTHGFPDFPDPDSQGVIHLPPSVDQTSSSFESALNKCQKGSMMIQQQQGDGASESPRNGGQ